MTLLILFIIFSALWQSPENHPSVYMQFTAVFNLVLTHYKIVIRGIPVICRSLNTWSFTTSQFPICSNARRSVHIKWRRIPVTGTRHFLGHQQIEFANCAKWKAGKNPYHWTCFEPFKGHCPCSSAQKASAFWRFGALTQSWFLTCTLKLAWTISIPFLVRIILIMKTIQMMDDQRCHPKLIKCELHLSVFPFGITDLREHSLRTLHVLIDRCLTVGSS